MPDPAVADPPKAAAPAEPAKVADPKAQAALDDKARSVDPNSSALKTLLGGDPPKEEKAPEKPKEKTGAEKIYGKEESAKESAKPEDKKAEASKPEADKPKEKSAEIKYELKLPKDSLLDAAQVEEVASFAKEKNLPPDVAQAILDKRDLAVRSYRDAQEANLKKISSEQWPAELKAHPDFGGKRFNETVELAKRAFHAYADKNLIAEMDRTGLGNHPAHLIAWARVGRAMQDDRIIPTGSPASAKPKSLADRLYGKKETGE